MDDTAQSRSRVVGKPKPWYRRKINETGPEEIAASTSKTVGDASTSGEGVTSNAVVRASNRGPTQSIFKFNFRKPKVTPIKTPPAVDPASQITSSNPVPTPDSSSPVPISKSSHEMNSSPSENNGPPVKKDLWQRAYDELGADKDNKTWIERYESLVKGIAKDENMPNDSGVEQQMAAFVRTRMKVMTNKQWILQWGSRSFNIRQQVDRIVKVIQSVSSIGSAAASLDPLHAGIAWAGICVVLPLILNDSEQSKLAETGLEKITDKIHYFVEMENLYWSAENVVRNSHFEDALVKLYREILAYESKCAWYFSRRTPNRTVRNILKIDGWADLIKDIDACENQCLQFSQILSNANQAKFQAVLSQQLDEIKLSLNRRYEIERINDDVVTWVSKVSVFDDHFNVRKSKLGSAYWNSGKWLLQKQEFIDWKKSSHGQLWLRGTVGTGKTCLTSIVISHLIETVTDERLAIFYCSGEKEYNRPIDVLRSLVAQLSCTADGKVISDIKAFYKENRGRHPDGSVLDLDQCVLFLVELSKFHGCMTIAIDALDECTDPRGLLICLETVCARSEKLKLFFSSRDGVLVHEQFPDCLKVRADTSESRGDIQDFIEGELGNPKRRNAKVITNEMANRLKDILIKRAGGMFRWVELQLALFISVERPIKNPTDVETKLQALESSTGEKIMDRLRKAYDEIYERNTADEPRSQELARRALKWILCSFRTLTIDELQHAVAVDKDMTDTWVRETSGYLLDICSNFIVVDQYGNVQFAHQSVREYLEKREMNKAQEFADVEAHTQVAETCLAFLNLSDTDTSQIMWFMEEGGFPGYAVLFWAEHCRLAGTIKGDLRMFFDEFILKGRYNTKFAKWLQNLSRGRDTLRYTLLSTSPTLEMNQRLDSVISSPPDPFFAACTWGFHDVVEHSLNTKNIELTKFEGYRERGLQIACEFGHLDIMKMLLKADPKGNVDARDQKGRTALHLAARNGHAEIVKVLLETDPKANIDAQDKDGWTALHSAALRGDAEIVKILLEAEPKANIDAEVLGGWTALHWAIYQRHVEIVNILIDLPVRAAYGADSQHRSFAVHPDSDGNDLLASLKYLILKRPNDNILHGMLGNEYVRLEKYGKARMAFDKSIYLKMKQLKARRIEDIVTYEYCDECGVRIYGRYYKCIQCGPNYDLCQACFQKSNHKHPLTDLIMIPSEQFVADTD